MPLWTTGTKDIGPTLRQFFDEQKARLGDEVHKQAKEFQKEVLTNLDRDRHDKPPSNIPTEAEVEFDQKVTEGAEDYRGSITVQELDEHVSRVSIPQGGHLSGLSYDQIARAIEYGTRSRPAVPHWRPAISKFRKEFPRKIGRV